ncbi:AbiV family abortive infection protein [Weissella soli]|uniref:AbiV family abortive infection protein n=1 Tax=Weissella soli TaxID=155866 RepID=UPI001F3DB41C|nr:AbiV family abortive infection protein [Weissella soli]GJM47973.1 hypothetical protein WSSLDB02_05300 [Weissella soli]
MNNSNYDDNRIKKIEKAFNGSTRFHIESSDDFNNAIDHIIGLLNDSFTLITSNSFGSAVFLAITALEETAKTHFSMYLKHDLNIKGNDDILMQHFQKHFLSVSPVFKIGDRLAKVLGNEKIDEIISNIDQKNGLMDLRNNAIYWYTDVDGNHFPKDYVDKNLAQELLLFSIEAFDDNLVGYTSYSIEASNRTDVIFQKVAEQYIV